MPASHEELWLVPPPGPPAPRRAYVNFTAGVRLLREGKDAEALRHFTAAGLNGTPLEHYARYHAGLAYLNLSRQDEARAAFEEVRAAQSTGCLWEAAALREAEMAVAASDHAGAARLYEDVARRDNSAPDTVLMALAQAQEQAGETAKAAATYARLYYQFPLSELAAVAETALGPKSPAWLREEASRYGLELRRAEHLFAARRYGPARDAFDLLRQVASGEDRDLAAMRVAECDHYVGRHQRAREGLQAFLDKGPRTAEARFFYLTATRGLNRHDEYVRRARELVRDFPGSYWAEETLNNLGTHYILVDEDEKAARVFEELYAAFPKGRHATRAAWKAGWWAYKKRRFDAASRFFESAAAAFPRSDYRPSYLYWAARAREQAGDREGATGVYRIVHADYQQSYYGRLTRTRLEKLGVALKVEAKPEAAAPGRPGKAAAVAEAADDRGDGEAPLPPNADLIRLLISLELYDLAREEVLFAQRTSGDSPLLNATLAWTYYKENDLRRGIIFMKRAYPQYLSAHGALLPEELLRVIYPMDYWPFISRYSKQHGLDPFLVAALINQESAFIPDARSSANAIGLMQILPSTGRRLARQQRLRFTTASLKRPDYNIRLGTAFFADLSKRLGGVHFALASYNAGAHRVALWRSERPGLERDEFIDDIPFPETQHYVKKILGSADDYRALYKHLLEGAAKPASSRAGSKAAKPARKPGAVKKPAKKPARTVKKTAKKPGR